MAQYLELTIPIRLPANDEHGFGVLRRILESSVGIPMRVLIRWPFDRIRIGDCDLLLQNALLGPLRVGHRLRRTRLGQSSATIYRAHLDETQMDDGLLLLYSLVDEGVLDVKHHTELRVILQKGGVPVCLEGWKRVKSTPDI